MNDERPEHPDHADHVAKDLALAPLRFGLGQRLRETVVEGAREELFTPTEAPRLEQFLGADHAERVEQLRADDVLPALSTREREIGDPRLVAPRRPCDKRRVLIVWMRTGKEHARRRLEPSEEMHESSGT